MASSTSAFSALVILQVLTRATNFGLGAVLARTLGPRWYALANVSLQLITSSALFLCKEGLRRACQRAYPGGSGAALPAQVAVSAKTGALSYAPVLGALQPMPRFMGAGPVVNGGLLRSSAANVTSAESSLWVKR